MLISFGVLKKYMIIGITPVRISFAGGGTDMPLWYKKNGGKVISTSINYYSYIFSVSSPLFLWCLLEEINYNHPSN